MEKIMKLFRATLMPLSIAALLIFPLNIVQGVIPTVTATISLPPGSEPWGVAYNPSNGLLYVTNFNSNTVSAICEDTSLGCTPINSVVTFPMPIGLADCLAIPNPVAGATYTGVAPTGIAYDSNNNYMYVASTCGKGFGEGAWDGGVSVISPLNVVTTIVPPGFTTFWGNRFTVGTTPFSVAFDQNPTSHMVYIANDGASIWGINDYPNTVVTEFNLALNSFICPTGNQCLLRGIAYDPASTGKYAKGICATASQGGRLVCIPAQTTPGHSTSLACVLLCMETVDPGISAGANPVGIFISASAANNIYVSELGSHQLCKWNSNGSAPACSSPPFAATSVPEGVAYGHIDSLTGNKVFVANVADTPNNNVFVCNPPLGANSCPVSQSPVVVGNYPIGITVVHTVIPLLNCFFVANAHSDTVSKVC